MGYWPYGWVGCLVGDEIVTKDIYDMQIPACFLSIHSPKYGVSLKNVTKDREKLEAAIDIANGPDYCGYIQVSRKDGETTYTPLTKAEFYKNG